MSARHFVFCCILACIAGVAALSSPTLAVAPAIVFVAVCVDAVCVALKESKK